MKGFCQEYGDSDKKSHPLLVINKLLKTKVTVGMPEMYRLCGHLSWKTFPVVYPQY